jgi:ornithine cyclodeaminase
VIEPAEPQPRWLSEADVVEAVNLPDAIRAVRAQLIAQSGGTASTMPKAHLSWEGGHSLHAIGAEAQAAGLVVTKTWAHTAGGATPLVVAWERDSGRLIAVVEAFALGQLRTAAVTAVATDLLAPPVATRAALVGAGRQALPQLAALTAVRPIAELRVWNRTPAAAAALAERAVEAGIAASVTVAANPAAAVTDAEIVTTATRSCEPLLAAADLAPGAHVNAVGAITPDRRELADDIAATAGTVVADDPDTARRLAVELAGAAEIVSLAAMAAGARRRPGRSLFKAMGIGLADLAVTAAVLEATGIWPRPPIGPGYVGGGTAGLAFDHPVKRSPRLT